MNKLLLITGMLIYGQSLQAQESALNYMQRIASEFKKIQGATWDYTKSVAKNKGARKVNKNRLELINTVQSSIKTVKAIGAFKEETWFRDSVLAFLNVNLAVVSEDYEKIMDLEDIKEQTYDAMDAYLKAQDVAGDKLAAAGEMADEVEKRFAEENNINLIESSDKVSIKLKKAAKVYDYYNPVYLIFFKAYKQEAYLLDAMSKGDVSGMEQNKNSLAQFAAEGLEKLQGIEAFESDMSLKTACVEMMNFYKKECESQLQTLIDFYTTKEAFEKAKKDMEAKGEKQRTQADVDNYNKLVNEFNKAVGDYNKVNNDLNNQRNKLINNWNNTSNNFTSKHVG